jgi:hypothetical protein
MLDRAAAAIPVLPKELLCWQIFLRIVSWLALLCAKTRISKELAAPRA